MLSEFHNKEAKNDIFLNNDPVCQYQFIPICNYNWAQDKSSANIMLLVFVLVSFDGKYKDNAAYKTYLTQ
jgi:hypothetical protein